MHLNHGNLSKLYPNESALYNETFAQNGFLKLEKEGSSGSFRSLICCGRFMLFMAETARAGAAEMPA